MDYLYHGSIAKGVKELKAYSTLHVTEEKVVCLTELKRGRENK